MERHPSLSLKAVRRYLGPSHKLGPSTLLRPAQGRRLSSRRFRARHNHLLCGRRFSASHNSRLRSRRFSGRLRRLVSRHRSNVSLNPRLAAPDRPCVPEGRRGAIHRLESNDSRRANQNKRG